MLFRRSCLHRQSLATKLGDPSVVMVSLALDSAHPPQKRRGGGRVWLRVNGEMLGGLGRAANAKRTYMAGKD